MSFKNMCLQYAEHGFLKQAYTELTYPPVIAACGVCVLAGCVIVKVASSETKTNMDIVHTTIIWAGISITAIAASLESLYG